MLVERKISYNKKYRKKSRNKSRKKSRNKSRKKYRKKYHNRSHNKYKILYGGAGGGPLTWEGIKDRVIPLLRAVNINREEISADDLQFLQVARGVADVPTEFKPRIQRAIDRETERRAAPGGGGMEWERIKDRVIPLLIAVNQNKERMSDDNLQFMQVVRGVADVPDDLRPRIQRAIDGETAKRVASGGGGGGGAPPPVVGYDAGYGNWVGRGGQQNRYFETLVNTSDRNSEMMKIMHKIRSTVAKHGFASELDMFSRTKDTVMKLDQSLSDSEYLFAIEYHPEIEKNKSMQKQIEIALSVEFLARNPKSEVQILKIGNFRHEKLRLFRKLNLPLDSVPLYSNPQLRAPYNLIPMLDKEFGRLWMEQIIDGFFRRRCLKEINDICKLAGVPVPHSGKDINEYLSTKFSGDIVAYLMDVRTNYQDHFVNIMSRGKNIDLTLPPDEYVPEHLLTFPPYPYATKAQKEAAKRVSSPVVETMQIPSSPQNRKLTLIELTEKIKGKSFNETEIDGFNKMPLKNIIEMAVNAGVTPVQIEESEVETIYSRLCPYCTCPIWITKKDERCHILKHSDKVYPHSNMLQIKLTINRILKKNPDAFYTPECFAPLILDREDNSLKIHPLEYCS